MKDYIKTLDRIYNYGNPSQDRTGVGTLSLFGEQMKFDLRNDKFPLLVHKKVSFKNILTELLWFISGNTNIQPLRDQGNTIWDEWADEHGNLGPVYGRQWRKWKRYVEVMPMEAQNGILCRVEEVDQLKNVTEILLNSPDSRRAVVSAWNVSDLPDMALEPCHVLFQFYTRTLSLVERIELSSDSSLLGKYNFGKRFSIANEIHLLCAAISEALDNEGIPKRTLSCRVDMRSMDFFLGTPYNVPSYALLTRMIARLCNMTAETLTFHCGNAHIYSNHMQQVKELLSRSVSDLKTPRLTINGNQKTIDDFQFSDFVLEDYHPMPVIKAPVAV